LKRSGKRQKRKIRLKRNGRKLKSRQIRFKNARIKRLKKRLMRRLGKRQRKRFNTRLTRRLEIKFKMKK